MAAMSSPQVIDLYTSLDVLVTGVSDHVHNGSAAIGYTQIGDAFYKLTFDVSITKWESFRDALVRGRPPAAATDNRSLYSIELALGLPESFQQEVTDALVAAHSRSLDAIG